MPTKDESMMSISDIITIVSLVIAIVAIINEKQRGQLVLKLHTVDYILFGLSFIALNYFVFYDQLYSKGIYIGYLYSSGFGFKNPKNWAYIIVMSTLLYLFYKILYSFYPYGKRNQVLRFYKKLIEINEVSFLLDLIDDFHKQDIIDYINSSKGYDTEDGESYFLRGRRKKTVKEWVALTWLKFVYRIAPWSRANRKLYGNLVLFNIINDPIFVELAANQRPYLFFEIFASFKKSKRDSFPDDLINRYLVQLLKNKNFWLIKELKECQRFDSGQPEHFFENNKILASLFADLTVSDVNEIWKPFGESAHEELDLESLKDGDSVFYNEFTDEKLLWECKTYIAIEFFKYLIIEAIQRKYEGSHFWLHYYSGLTEKITGTFDKHGVLQKVKMKSVYYKFIEEMENNILWWLDTSNKEDDAMRFYDVILCLGSMLHAISKCNSIDDKSKVGFIGRILYFYCSLTENTHSETMRTELDKILKKPSMLTAHDSPYFALIAKAWADFDTVPHVSSTGGEYAYFTRLKNNVIIPLGLDPNQPY